MVTSVHSGNSNQALQQSSQAQPQKPSPTELARQRAAEESKRQAQEAASHGSRQPAPTTNTHGQTTGSIINTTA